MASWMGVAEPTGEVFVVMVEAGGCHMFISGCLQWTTAVSVAWQWSVWGGTVSEDGTSSIGTSIVGLFGLQRMWWVAQLGWAIRCVKSSEDSTSDYSGSLI